MLVFVDLALEATRLTGAGAHCATRFAWLKGSKKRRHERMNFIADVVLLYVLFILIMVRKVVKNLDDFFIKLKKLSD
jgi:hypothetical protein